MGLFSKVTDPLGVKKKSAEAVGLGKVHKAMTDPFGVGEKLEDKTKEALGFDFENFHFKEIGKDLLRNPERMFIGSLDPMSTKMWNKVLGRDDKPIINQMGGPAEHRYADYIAQGGDPEAAENAARAHQVAGAVASIYAGGALGAAAGAGAGAAGATVTPAMQTAITSGATMAVPVGAAMADAEFTPEVESTSPLGGLGQLWVGNVPTYRRARGGLARIARMRYGGYR